MPTQSYLRGNECGFPRHHHAVTDVRDWSYTGLAGPNRQSTRSCIPSSPRRPESIDAGMLSRCAASVFHLYGGPILLPPALRKDRSLLIWNPLPDERTGRYAIDTEYMCDDENAPIGTLMLGEEGKQFLAQGSNLSIGSAESGSFFETGMRGSAKAMQDFGVTCGHWAIAHPGSANQTAKPIQMCIWPQPDAGQARSGCDSATPWRLPPQSCPPLPEIRASAFLFFICSHYPVAFSGHLTI